MLNYKLILVDTPGIIHASFHYNAFTCDTVLLSNMRALNEAYPGAVVVALFDHPTGKDARRAIYPKYKSRPHKDSIEEVITTCWQQLVASGYLCWQEKGYEADDLIATLCRHYKGTEILIYGKDKDHHANICDTTHQLITSIKSITLDPNQANVASVDVDVMAADAMSQINGMLQQEASKLDEQPPFVEHTLPKEKLVFVDATRVYDAYGVWPRQWIEYRAMMGDPSDTVPGVSDIGAGTASKVLQAADNLEVAASMISTMAISPARKRKLQAAFDDQSIWMWKKLVSPMICQPIPQPIIDAIDSGLRGEVVDTSKTDAVVSLNSDLAGKPKTQEPVELGLDASFLDDDDMDVVSGEDVTTNKITQLDIGFLDD